MKETIYTIPVNEAFAESGRTDCPFCFMRRKLNENAIEFVMGPSYMEDDVRMETNKIGFCARHTEEMYLRPNRLGLALMTHTHLIKINADLGSLLKKIKPNPKKSLFGGTKNESATSEVLSYLKKIEDSCYICSRVEDTFSRYIDTYFFLWNKDGEIKKMTESSGGFCLKHFRDLLETGEKKLSASEYDKFLQTIVPLQLKELKTLEDDLDWFTRKFDYRYVNEPWKNSKDALVRGIKKISSVTVSE